MKILWCALLFAMPLQLVFGYDYAKCNGTPEKPCLVLDTVDNNPKIKDWRFSPNNIWLSGSGAPSVQGFQVIADLIKKTTLNKVQHIIDVDLRQESHGYLNSNAITLGALNDWVNVGKSRDEVLLGEAQWLKNLSSQKQLVNVLSHKQFKENIFNPGETVIVNNIVDEKSVAEAAGMDYFRLTVTDHMSPADGDVDRFVELVKNLKPFSWLHIHCRGGDGRTTTFMVMYDMLLHANKDSIETINKRQASVEPFYDVLNKKSDNPVKGPLYIKRTEFLQKFYLFAKDYLNGYEGSWSSWIKTHK